MKTKTTTIKPKSAKAPAIDSLLTPTERMKLTEWVNRTDPKREGQAIAWAHYFLSRKLRQHHILPYRVNAPKGRMARMTRAQATRAGY